MGNSMKDALAYVVTQMKLDFAAWFDPDYADKRAFLPNDRPRVLDHLALHDVVAIIYRPRLEIGGLIRQFLCIVDFCAIDEAKAIVEAEKYLGRIESVGPRNPLPTLAPQLRSIDEDKFYRANVMHMLQLRPDTP